MRVLNGLPQIDDDQRVVFSVGSEDERQDWLAAFE